MRTPVRALIINQSALRMTATWQDWLISRKLACSFDKSALVRERGAGASRRYQKIHCQRPFILPRSAPAACSRPNNAVQNAYFQSLPHNTNTQSYWSHDVTIVPVRWYLDIRYKVLPLWGMNFVGQLSASGNSPVIIVMVITIITNNRRLKAKQKLLYVYWTLSTITWFSTCWTTPFYT